MFSFIPGTPCRYEALTNPHRPFLFSDKLVLLPSLVYYQVNLILNYFSEHVSLASNEGVFGNYDLAEPDSGCSAVTLEQMMKMPVMLFTETLGRPPLKRMWMGSYSKGFRLMIHWMLLMEGGKRLLYEGQMIDVYKTMDTKRVHYKCVELK